MTEMCPKPLDCSTAYGTLTVNGWSMHNGGFCVPDLSVLLETAEFRGENVPVEHLPGQVARAKLEEQTVYPLPVVFSGAVNRLGVKYANPVGGLHANRRALVGRLIDPIRTGTATVPATLVFPSGTGGAPVTISFACQPMRLHAWQLLPGGYATAVLDLQVPVPTALTAGVV